MSSLHSGIEILILCQ